MRKQEARERREKMTKELANSLLPKLSGRKRRSLEEALSCERQVDWLSHAPLQWGSSRGVWRKPVCRLRRRGFLVCRYILSSAPVLSENFALVAGGRRERGEAPG